MGQWTLAPGSFSRPECIWGLIGFVSEQEVHQIFQKHIVSQPLPASQVAQSEPCSMIHRGCFLNPWPSRESWKNIWSSKLKSITFQSETSLPKERGVKGTEIKGMIYRLSSDILSHMAITILGAGGEARGQPLSLLRFAVGMKRYGIQERATLRLVALLGAEACPSNTKLLF